MSSHIEASKPILLNINNTVFKTKDYITQVFPFLFAVEAYLLVGLKEIGTGFGTSSVLVDSDILNFV